jgi:DNA topoisomerase-6 subunit B
VDIKQNKGVFKSKETVDWDKPHGTRVEFLIDGRVQLNGEGGVIAYLDGTVLVNPHLTLEYKLHDQEPIRVERVANTVPEVPEATLPHPQTFKLGELMTHASLYGKTTVEKFLKTGFSRVTDATLKDLVAAGLPKSMLDKPCNSLGEPEFKTLYQAIQKTEFISPSTKSVLTIGEEGLSESIKRLGVVDFFAVVTRKPTICDFKPVVVEVALARFKNKAGEPDDPVQLLRFANRVPLQFDKASCAITKAIESVNWRAYGLNQPKGSLPLGPYIFAVSVTSPFIKFKNASKETIDASDELVEEIRRALIQAGQKLSKHIKREFREADLERKLAHIEQFGPILVETLGRLTKANPERLQRAQEGLKKILGRDSQEAEQELKSAEVALSRLERAKLEKGKDGTQASFEIK